MLLPYFCDEVVKEDAVDFVEVVDELQSSQEARRVIITFDKYSTETASLNFLWIDSPSASINDSPLIDKIDQPGLTPTSAAWLPGTTFFTSRLQ